MARGAAQAICQGKLGRRNDRFLTEGFAYVPDGGAGDGVVLRGVRGDVEHFGPAFGEVAGDRRPRSTITQIHIDERDIGRIAVPQRGLPIGSNSGHVKPGVNEDPLDVHRDEDFVLNNQD